MSVCTFFGHRDCYDLDHTVLEAAIEDLIGRGVDRFYVGHQGAFDGAVLSCLRRLRTKYSHIAFSVVLAYMPRQNTEYDLYADCSIYPEGLELAIPRFAIAKRNKWMLEQAEYCICYVNHTWGGAYRFASLASRRGLTVLNLGNVSF